MYTLRTIKWLFVIGCFVLLMTACASHHVSTSNSNQAARFPLGTTLLKPLSASSVFSVAWSPDGQHLALGYADGSVEVRNAITGNIDFTVQGHLGQVWMVAWSPDGKRLA